MQFNIVEGFLIILFAALIITVIFRHLKIPIILGYVIVGILVGPQVFGWFTNTETIKNLAEFGVVLLMFTVGLEFSLKKLFSLRYAVFVLGGLQVILSILFTIIIGIIFKMPIISALVIGFIVSMSSTAIVIKQLSEQNELDTQHGNIAVGILLFQDLAVIPMLVFIASNAAPITHSFTETLFSALSKGIIATIVILILGQWILRPLFRIIEKTETIELFTLNALFVAVGAAWFTNFLGLSYALGAFLAGIMLAECEHKNKIKNEIRPFRDLLLALFFISTGMLVHITLWAESWFWIILLTIGLMLAKALLITVLTKFSKYNLEISIKTGLILAQGGEFGFAILSLALANHLLPAEWGQSALAALLISFAFAPAIIRYNALLTKFFCKTKNYQRNIREKDKKIKRIENDGK